MHCMQTHRRLAVKMFLYNLYFVEMDHIMQPCTHILLVGTAGDLKYHRISR